MGGGGSNHLLGSNLYKQNRLKKGGGGPDPLDTPPGSALEKRGKRGRKKREGEGEGERRLTRCNEANSREERGEGEEADWVVRNEMGILAE